MCGINGFNYKSIENISIMNKQIIHRGPDHQDSFIDNQVSLGHVRLSIIDLSSNANQPMKYSHNDKEIVIVFNGEIYNFKELKKILINKGYYFKTKSDTEVLLASYLEWGEKCVEKFNGMWSFCIYDKEEEILFCSRDRLGQKPFYYYHDNNTFIFSSELKGILSIKKLNHKKYINSDALRLYFTLGFIPSPYTIYKNIFKLKQSHNLIFNLKNKKINIYKYYEIPEMKPIKNRKRLIKEGKNILYDSTKIRLFSDVKLGAFLSGGLDSTSIVGFMKELIDINNINTFSIGFIGKNDETLYANIAHEYFNTIHKSRYFSKKDFNNILSIHPYIYDEPFGDPSSFPTCFLSKLAKEEVTISLSGDGGDEIFGGYSMYRYGYYVDKLSLIPNILKKGLFKLFNTFNISLLNNIKIALKISISDLSKFYEIIYDDVGYSSDISNNWLIDNMNYCLNKTNNNLSEALRLFDLLYNKMGDNFLVKVDRASMFYALEIRSPFLDYRLMELSQRIPNKYKINNKNNKILLKNILAKMIPIEIIKRNKKGFTPPLINWINNNNNNKKIFDRGLFILKNNYPDIFKYYKSNKFHKHKPLYLQYLTRLFNFTLWWDYWIENYIHYSNSK